MFFLVHGAFILECAAMDMQFSIWLMPKAGAQITEQLSKMVDKYSTKYRGPRFPPHCTLVANAGKSQEICVKQTRLLASELKVI